MDLEVTSTIRGAASGTCDLEPVAELCRSTRLVGELGGEAGALLVGSMMASHVRPDRLVGGDAGDLGPARVGVDVPVVGVGLEDADGAASVSSRSWSADACTSRACAASASRLEEEVGEHRDLGPQLVRGDGREDEVDRALGVAVGRRSRRCRTR